MKISQLIHKLSMIQDEHGNVEVEGENYRHAVTGVSFDGEVAVINVEHLDLDSWTNADKDSNIR